MLTPLPSPAFLEFVNKLSLVNDFSLFRLFALGGNLTKRGRRMAVQRRQLATAATMGRAEELKQLDEDTDGCLEEAGATAGTGRGADGGQTRER